MADHASERVSVGPDGTELVPLARSLPGAERRVVGLVGAPGAGKSTLAAELARLSEAEAAVVPMDGFHLADVELRRQGLLERKGAPETFDAAGYAALLGRLHAERDGTVYAPGFERTLEQPLAGAIAVPPEVSVVLTEGNYLLLGQGPWPAVRAQLDEVWFVVADERLRVARLVARHVGSGKSEKAAREWVARVDGPNAEAVAGSIEYADRVVDVTRWRAAAGG